MLKLIVGILLSCTLLLSCGTFPITTSSMQSTKDSSTSTESNSLIDREVERVNSWNEAYRKIVAAGCTNGNLRLMPGTTILPNKEYYEYECVTVHGTILKLKKIDGEWIIHGAGKKPNRLW